MRTLRSVEEGGRHTRSRADGRKAAPSHSVVQAASWIASLSRANIKHKQKGPSPRWNKALVSQRLFSLASMRSARASLWRYEIRSRMCFEWLVGPRASIIHDHKSNLLRWWLLFIQLRRRGELRYTPWMSPRPKHTYKHTHCLSLLSKDYVWEWFRQLDTGRLSYGPLYPSTLTQTFIPPHKLKQR